MNIDYLLLTHGIGVSTEANSTAPSPISNFNAALVNSSIQLSWVNPTDTNFLGVRIQKKIGSYPVSVTDGDTVFDGIATSYVDTNVNESITYYYRAFAYGYMNMINDHISQQTSIAFNAAKVYTVIINTSNSNPSASVTYADDAVGMVAGSNAWDSIFPFSEIKPVMFKDGVVNYFLNPNNFAQKLGGATADITSGTDGDVMIQFPKIYTYIRKDGNLIYVSLSERKVNANYKCYAHTKSGIEKDYLYIGAYTAHTENTKLRSLSSVLGTPGISLSQARTYAQNNGIGYQLFSYYQLLMIQVLYLIKYKNLNSQTTVGQGVSSTETYAINGVLNSQGMAAGNTAGSVKNAPVKLFGMENLWGNYYELVDGIMTDSSLNVYTTNENFNNERIGYTNHGVAMFNYVFTNVLYFSNAIGTTELGFLPIGTSNGSSATYFSDGTYFEANAGLALSGSWEDGNCGIFYVDFNSSYDTADYLASRLAFL